MNVGRYYIFVLLLLMMMSCRQQDFAISSFAFEFNGRNLIVSLERVNDTLSIIKTHSSKPGMPEEESLWPLPYPVFRFDCADITGDKIPEIAVGVIKPTHFDPQPKKRLFLFKLFDSTFVRPLWLGSQLSHPLVDFKLKEGSNGYFIRSMEEEENGHFLLVDYTWKSFAPEWKNYVKRDLDKETAEILLYEN